MMKERQTNTSTVDMSLLTQDQRLLLSTISYLKKWVYIGTTQTSDSGMVWIKELPLLAIIYYQIIKGQYKTYDYAPTAIQFFGRSCYTVNLAYEAIDDIEDLRELKLLEKIRLSTSKHGFITGYRITKLGEQYISNINQEIKDNVHSLFYCKKCQVHIQLVMKIECENPEIIIDCPECDNFDTELSFMVAEDVNYKSKPYFLKSGKLLVGDQKRW